MYFILIKLRKLKVNNTVLRTLLVDWFFGQISTETTKYWLVGRWYYATGSENIIKIC